MTARAKKTERRIAVVLFNLGGPDGPDAVQPFLFNLFRDPAIIGVPNPMRWLLAQLISRRRAPVARAIYENLGGGSPLLPNTRVQAHALENALSDRAVPDVHARVFIAMRYWHPFADEAAEAVAAYGPTDIVLLPLYPQFSTTTVASSMKDWHRAARTAGLSAPTRTVCCYPTQAGFVAAMAEKIRAAKEASPKGARILFSAHGVPKKIVDRGDPYQWQVEQTAAATASAAGLAKDEWIVCYQSRVGPLEWIGPATEDEIERAGTEKLPLIVVPIAFVSEHSETLVELDIEYRELAEKSGVPSYTRVGTVDDAAPFIDGLADLVETALADGRADIAPDPAAAPGGRLCPASFGKCPCRA